MNLGQGPAAANICNDGDDAGNRERLEERPAVVVQEEHTLHRNNASKEKAVGDRAGAECLASVIEVSSKTNPHSHKSGQREENCEHENAGDNLGGRLCVCFEDVVDLGLGGVALRCGWESERSRRVAGDVQVEDVLVDWGGRPE